MDFYHVHLSVPPPAGLGWGPRQRRGADSLRSLDKLGTLSEVEGLAGESRWQRDRLVTWFEEEFYEVIYTEELPT